MRSFGLMLLCLIAAAAGCRSRANEPSAEVRAASPGSQGEQPRPAPAAAVAPAAKAAAIGEPAPDFTLPALDGSSVSLASFKGKTVVLEWFNPECPFVRNSYTKGSLVGTAEKHRSTGVVWLAINSGAPGKQGAGREKNLEARDEFGMKHPILLDESGAVGKLYGAKTTPHIFVIAPDGKLVYRGAIDNSPDGEREAPKDGKLVNYADEAIAAVAASRPPANPETEPYGCSVKYAK